MYILLLRFLPDISSLGQKGELNRSLKQAFSVKQIQREIKFFQPLKSWSKEQNRIPYIVFSKVVCDLEKTTDFLDDQKRENSWSPWDLPDMIVGMNDGIIYHAPEVSTCSIRPQFEEKGVSSGEHYLILQTGPETLITFLALLYSFAPPRPQLGDMILKEYLFPIDIPKMAVLSPQ